MGLSRRTLLKGALLASTGVASNFRSPALGALGETPPLRVLADRLGFRIGCITNPGGADYERYRERLRAIQKREFNVGSEWASWNFIEPSRGTRDFRWLEYQLAEAKVKGLSTFGYNLINPSLGGGLPVWVQDVTSRADLIASLTSLVTDTLTYAKGRVYAWNVLCESQPPQGDIFQSLIGPEYIEIIFAAARKADPSILLCYTDYQNAADDIFNPRYRLTKRIVDDLRAAHIVDLVGIENPAYWAANPTDYGTLVSGFQSYGVPIIITEFAVPIHPLSGTQESRYSKQADIYATVLQAALDSGVCRDFLLETIGDNLSMWETAVGSLPSVFPDNDPTPVDDDLQPKPAYYAMASVLQKAVDARFRYRSRLPLLATDR